MGGWPADTMGRTALITGITGQDGSYLTELLLEKGYVVHGLSRKAVHSTLSGGSSNRLFLHSCDVIDYSTVFQLIREIRPDEVYNLAAQSHVGLSFKQPELTVAASGLGVVNLLEAIQEAGLADRTRFFEASSCEIIGRASAAAMDERSPLHPQTPYGKSKLLAFLAVKHYRDACCMYACSGILFNHESPRRGESFVTRKITQAAVNIKLGKQDYVYCMWLMLQQSKPADYIIGTGVNTSVRQFVELAFERVDLPIRWQGPKGMTEVGVLAQGPNAGRVLVTICADFFRPVEGTMTGNPSKASKELGWRQVITVRQLINEMVDADMALAMDAQAQH